MSTSTRNVALGLTLLDGGVELTVLEGVGEFEAIARDMIVRPEQCTGGDHDADDRKNSRMESTLPTGFLKTLTLHSCFGVHSLSIMLRQPQSALPHQEVLYGRERQS